MNWLFMVFYRKVRTVRDAQGMDGRASFGWLGADREETLPKVGEVLQRKAKCQ